MKFHFAVFMGHEMIFVGFSCEIHGIFIKLQFIVIRTGQMSLSILCQNLQKQVLFANAAQPNCDSSLLNGSPALSWLSGDKKLWCWHWFFSVKQQLNTGRSLPVPYLNLWFCSTTTVTAKTVICKISFIEQFLIRLFAFNGLCWFCKKQSFIPKIVCLAFVCFFNHNEMKVSCITCIS